MTEIDQLQAENAELHRYHAEDRAALDEMRATIERLRGGLENRSQDLNRAAMDAVRYADEVARLRTTASDLTPYRRLLARLEADRAGHLRAAEQTEDGRLRDVGSSYAAALHHAATLAVAEFEGAEAAQEYAAKNTKLHQGQDDDRVASEPAATNLRERVTAAIRAESSRVDDIALADAVLAVLPAPADRAAVLREAAHELGRMDYDTDSNDYGYDTYCDAWNGGVMDGADLLRRIADGAQQPANVTARCGQDIETALGTYRCERDADHSGDCDERTEAEIVEQHPASGPSRMADEAQQAGEDQ